LIDGEAVARLFFKGQSKEKGRKEIVVRTRAETAKRIKNKRYISQKFPAQKIPKSPLQEREKIT